MPGAALITYFVIKIIQKNNGTLVFNSKEIYFFLQAPAIYSAMNFIPNLLVTYEALLDYRFFHTFIFRLITCGCSTVSSTLFAVLFVLPLMWNDWSLPYYFDYGLSTLISAAIFDLAILMVNTAPSNLECLDLLKSGWNRDLLRILAHSSKMWTPWIYVDQFIS